MKLHNEYSKDNVVCISLSVDSSVTEEPLEKYDKAWAFLKRQNATFTNFFLKEQETDAWQTHFDVFAAPAVFVYDTTGKRFGDLHSENTYEDVEKLVKKLLNQ